MKITNHIMDCKQIISPNQSGSIVNPTLLVLHYTASGDNRDGDEKYFQKRAAKASAHIVIERDGEVTQCVPFNKKAWHAGRSVWKGKTNCNAFSIGIEIDNWGLLTKRADGSFISHTGTVIPKEKVMEAPNKLGRGRYWEIYDPRQLESLREVVKTILETYPSITEIVGHEDISPRRKIDPGPALYDFMRTLSNEFHNGRKDCSEIETRVVNAKSLNVRSGPSTKHAVVASLKYGDTVKVIYDGGNWSRLDMGIGEAWVYDKYLS